MSDALDEDLAAAVGRREERRDLLRPEPAAALHGLLERPGSPPQPGDALPMFWRQLYFLDAPRRSALGRDGHVAPGVGLVPASPLPRRMWAGGRIEATRPAPIGEKATKISEIASIVRKDGRSGPLLFITLRHSLYVAGRRATTPVEVEEQDLVYRRDPAPPETEGPRRPDGPTPPKGAHWRRPLSVDPVLLFRYSALTYNGHRIHYDLDYCRRVEGYPGLVVHGPLLATLLLELVRDEGEDRPLARFSFRARSPAFDTELLEACGGPCVFDDGTAGARLWIQTVGAPERLVMTAEAVYA